MSSVSIIIPTYNRAPTILRAVTSVLEQCEADDEIIVVDDGSNDNTEEILKELANQIIYHKIPNGGAGSARNFGLDIAQNEFIAFLDSDDEWMPGKLSLQRQFLDARPEIVFCFSDMTAKYADGSAQKYLLRKLHGISNIGERIIGPGVALSRFLPTAKELENVGVHIGNYYLMQMSYICVQVNTTLIRRAVIGDQLRFPTDLTYHEDWEFFSRLSKMGPCAFFDYETAWLHFHTLPQLTKTSMLNIHVNRLKVLNRVWGADENYTANYGYDVRKRIREEQTGLLNEFIDRKMFEEIRAELENIDRPPFKFLIVKYCPDTVLNLLIYFWKNIKKLLTPASQKRF